MADYVYPPVIGALKTLFRAYNITFQEMGYENMPATGGALIVSNHISYLDFIFVGLPAVNEHKRLTRFMAKKSVFDHKISGPLMRGMHHIPVNRKAGGGSMRVAIEALNNGELVGVFPEATISTSFRVKSMKTGAVRMAAEAGVPIIPMAVWGTQRFWTKGRKLKMFRNHTVTLNVGKPITVTTDDDPEEATAHLRSVIQELVDQAQLAHPDATSVPPNAWWMPAHLGGTAPKLTAENS